MRRHTRRGLSPGVAFWAALGLVGALTCGTVAAEWEPAVPVDHEPADPFGSTYFLNALAVGSNGLTTALFFQKGPDTQPANSTTGSPFALRRAAGATAAWIVPVVIATPAAGQTTGASADLMSKDDGTALGIFRFTPAGGSPQSLAATLPAGAAATALPTLCTADATPKCATFSLRVAFDGAGNGYASGVMSGAGGDLLFARTSLTTGAWQPALVVKTDARNPSLAVDPASNVVLVYARNDLSANGGLGATRIYGRRMLTGASDFEAEVLISGANAADATVTSPVVIDPSGTATVTFLEGTVPSTTTPQAVTLRAVRWSLGAAPMPGQTLSDASQGQIPNPGVLAVDPQNRVTAAWYAARAVAEAGAVYVAQFVNGQWGAVQLVTPEDSSHNFTIPQLAADDTGALTLIYADNPGPGSILALVAQRKPVDGPWSAPTTLSSTVEGAGNVQSNSYHVAARKAGQADVTFVQTLDGVNRLFATRFLDDSTAPVITVTTPQDGATYTRGNTVNASYGCVDESGGSGIASCVGSVASGQPIDTGTLGVRQFTVTATDVAGNTATRIVNYTVQADTAAPAIIITTPQNGATYSLQQAVNADYACQDESSGSGIATCAGTVADGQPIDTQTPGTKTFTVTATDIAGNSAVMDVQYTVQAPPTVPPPDPPPEQPPGLQSNNTFFGGSLGLYAALVLLLASGLRRARLRCRYV